VRYLGDDCLDRFYDDVEAVVNDILSNTNAQIRNLEGWIVPRLRAATVNAHRRRRGERGALQRPRLPGWLDEALGHDPWLGHLSVALLTWVGAPITAGASLWPLDRWSDLRAEVIGDWTSRDLALVRCDVDRVLTAMRTRPRWYAENVERPLGAKTPAVASIPNWEGIALEPLALVEEHVRCDSRLADLAAVAIDLIRRRISLDPNVRDATREVLLELFGQTDLAMVVAAPPHTAPGVDEQVHAILADPKRLNAIVEEIATILDERNAVEM
jgi:hypothetical protein